MDTNTYHFYIERQQIGNATPLQQTDGVFYSKLKGLGAYNEFREWIKTEIKPSSNQVVIIKSFTLIGD